jgi:hypothetical protein
VVRSLFQVGISLQGAADLPHDIARERIAGGSGQLNETIRDIRDHVFTCEASGIGAAGRPPPNGPS